MCQNLMEKAKKVKEEAEDDNSKAVKEREVLEELKKLKYLLVSSKFLSIKLNKI